MFLNKYHPVNEAQSNDYRQRQGRQTDRYSGFSAKVTDTDNMRRKSHISVPRESNAQKV